MDVTRLYGASADATHLTSYAVVNSSYLQQTSTVEARGRCANTTAGYLMASRRFPNYVFTSSWSGGDACGQTSFVDPSGDLRGVSASWPYSNRSVVRGLELGRGYGLVLYSADQGADALWTHSYGLYGETYLLGRYNVPRGSGPRHLEAHAFGKYLYAVMATTNTLVPYLVDPYTGVVRYNDTAYALMPPGYNASDFAAADLKLARSESYLWAVTQARPGARLAVGGFLSGFLLDDDGSIVKRMFTVPTSVPTGPVIGAGGLQALTPATWGSEYAALTDATTGYVEMWQMVGGHDSNYGTDYKTARAVARLDMEGGCCSNAVWFN